MVRPARIRSRASYGVLVAGGTGGHINSAIALGEKFESCQFYIEYISGWRHLDFKLYHHKNCQHVPSYPLVGKGFLAILSSFFFNFFTFLILLFKFLCRRPQFVFGAGGYVCGPALLAAYLIGIPIFILEQNSVMGLTNRLLSKFSRVIFTCFHSVKNLKNVEKVKNYGNPLRKEFLSTGFWEKAANNKFHILVFGGSLGAQDINNLLLALLRDYKLDMEISILHQTGKNQVIVDKVNQNIYYRQVEYLDDIASEYRKSHFIICRGGGSTISELRVVKRPVIIIPIQCHKDQHQIRNANSLKAEAKFPVYVELVENLLTKRCEKLQNLIEAEYQKYQSSSSKAESLQVATCNSSEDSSTLIVKEVLENV